MMIAAVVLVLSPLVGAALAMPLGLRVSARYGELASVFSVSLSGVLAIFMLLAFIWTGISFSLPLLTWIETETFAFNWAIRVDSLSVIMFFVVSVVSALVHIYSLGYMSHDPSRPRFFAYLSLFTFMMLALVSADNFLQLFFGWEGVGLASYLLIGFWHEKPAPTAAAMKAFIVNRVGDAAFILGMGLLFYVVGSLDYDAVFASGAKLAATQIALPFGFSIDAANLTGFFLLFGAMGKSAQFLLHTWLPDAMEGPTPVSALIHAATMVTAGVFMIARVSPIYEVAQTALLAVALVGGVTALFAATIGLVQTDIKRVIAYSTCSQLGYMFAALGLGAYAVAIFHLATHAFFKALLFLGAGSVIHSLEDEQDMNNMGGLNNHKMPLTWATMLIGTLGLTGFPLTAGYFSKDAIIEAAYESGSLVAVPVFWLLLISAALTSFYAWRLFFLTFHSAENSRTATGVHSAHESAPIMTVPLVLLALGALIAGGVFYHILVGAGNVAFWQNAIPQGAGGNILETLHHAPFYIVLSPLFAALIGFAVAVLFYLGNSDIPNSLIRRGAWVYRFLFHKWYFDELYNSIFTRPSFALGRFFWHRGDEQAIDGLGPNGVSARVLNVAGVTPSLQTGYLYHYAFLMLIGLTAMVSWLVFSNTDWASAQAGLIAFYNQSADFILNLPAWFAGIEMPNFGKLWEEWF